MPAKPDAPAGKDPPGAASMFIIGAVMGTAGVVMIVRVFTGTSEFVHVARTNHWLLTLLGEHAFTVLAAIVCLLFGAGGIAGGVMTLREQAATRAKEAERGRGTGRRRRERDVDADEDG